MLFTVRRRHLTVYIGIAILFILIGILIGNLHGWHECRWFYGVGTPSASNNTDSLKLLKELRGLIQEATFDKVHYEWRAYEILEQLRAGA